MNRGVLTHTAVMTIMYITANAPLLMFSKIANILSIISFLMVSSMSVFAYMAVKYMQSPEFERTLKNKLMGSLEDKLSDVMKSNSPDVTGPSIQLPEPIKVNQFGNTKN